MGMEHKQTGHREPKPTTFVVFLVWTHSLRSKKQHSICLIPPLRIRKLQVAPQPILELPAGIVHE